MLLKQFDVHEDSFDFTPKEVPVFANIKDFLEKRNGSWWYKDYSQNSYDSEEEVGKMMKLKLDKCK